jgi:hypothetical protein
MKALECAWCEGAAHFVDGKFMGCCVSGHCENEGFKTIAEWNNYTILSLGNKAERLRNAALVANKEARQIEARLAALAIGIDA